MTCQSWHLRARFRPYVWENREKRDKKIQLCATLRTAEWCKWSCFCFFPEDIMNVLARTEPDFEILILSEFYGRFLVKFWPFFGF